jgi:tRNA(adenine34) deaminase
VDPTIRRQSAPFLREAIRLALDAEEHGNLPIGAVIALDGRVVAKGQNFIWSPTLALTRHAEMEALQAVPQGLWPRAREMTLFTTLEPCIMCAGAILLHHLGRLVFGSADPAGGLGAAAGSLPRYFKEEMTLVQWMGPALPEECDALYARVLEHLKRRGPSPPRFLAAAQEPADALDGPSRTG